jgi:hypothetical protein
LILIAAKRAARTPRTASLGLFYHQELARGLALRRVQATIPVLVELRHELEVLREAAPAAGSVTAAD